MKALKNTLLICALTLVFHSTSKAQDFYHPEVIQEVKIFFDEPNWDTILEQYYDDGNEERLLGSVELNGQLFDSVGVRYKGNSSYNNSGVKKPFNIKLDYVVANQTYQNYGTLKLGNLHKDPSCIREVLSYEIARKYFPASMANYAKVFVNDEYMGLYSNVQDVDKYFKRTHFKSDNNWSVKGEISTQGLPGQMGGVWQYFGADSSSYQHLYALESDFGWNELVEFLEQFNNEPALIPQILNIDRHLWFLAFQNLLVNLDGPLNNPQNYYLYQDNNQRVNPIPWDLNESFGVFTNLQSSGPLNIAQLQQLSPFVNANEADYPIVNKVLNTPGYQKKYLAHLRTMMEEIFMNGWYIDRANQLQSIIDSEVQNDPNAAFAYQVFTNSLTTNYGFGPQAIIGIEVLMNARINYLSNLSYFTATPPSLETPATNDSLFYPGDEIIWEVNLSHGDSIWLYYRTQANGIFESLLMKDDGLYPDNQAGDSRYTVSMIAGSRPIEYYFYASNQEAGRFLPERAEYEYYQVNVVGNVVINELMADNETGITNELGNQADWIELYNNSDSSIVLTNYFLTDDPSEPLKWTFPDTTIAPGNFLLIWADDEVGVEGLHANFKLSKSGESILLSNPEGILLDRIDFPEQLADTSYGRYENGIGAFTPMIPSPGAVNSPGLITIPEIESSLATELQIMNYPNPFRSATQIQITTPESGNCRLLILNTQGRIMKQLFDGYLPAGQHEFRYLAGNQQPGMYFLVIQTNQTQITHRILQIP